MGKPSRTIDILGPSFLIQANTSKGVNSTIRKLGMYFLDLKHVLWRFGSLLWLFYSERSQLGFLLSGGMRTHSPTCACVVNAYVRIRTHMCIGSLGFRVLFPIWNVISLPRPLSWLLRPKELLKINSSTNFHASKRKRKWKSKDNIFAYISKVPMSCEISTCPKIKSWNVKMFLKYNPMSQMKSKVQKIVRD